LVGGAGFEPATAGV